MANPTIRIKRSSTPNKVPGTDQLLLGELAINTFDGKLYLEQDQTSASGITTVVSVNPWNVGVGTLAYDINFTAGSVGIGTTNTLAVVTSSNTAVLAAGIVTAFKYFGDGSGLTGISASGVTLSATAPSSPSDGDLWWNSEVGELYIYYSDGTSDQWVETSGGSETVTISDTAPSSPNSGDLWWDSDDGTLFIRYDDGNTEQWIDATGALSSGLLYWQETTAGIHTLGNVGIATTNPRYSLEVGPVGYADTSLWVNGNARVTGILSVGQGTIVLDGSNDLVNVGTALTLGHTQGIQFHTQRLHTEGFEVNNINVSGIITATGGLRIGNTEVIDSSGVWQGSATGLQGATGNQGNQGATGNQGNQGATGNQGNQGATGNQGNQGATGNQGNQGATGNQGNQGATGNQGADGNFGGATFDYTFSGTTTDSDPGQGGIRFNNATLSSATQMFIDDTDDNGTDIQTFLRTIDDSTSGIKGHFRVSNRLNADDFAIFTINGASTEATGYFKIPCTHLSGATSFSAGEDVIVTFARTGDKGDQGNQGNQGATGNQGNQGATGNQGNQGATGNQGNQGATGNQGNQGATGNQGNQGATGPVGGATGTDYNDNVKVRFGTGNDTEVYFDGVDTIIDHTSSSGTLRLRGDAIALQTTQATPETYISCNADSSVQLYHNNSEKLATTSNGITVTNRLDFGASTGSIRWPEAGNANSRMWDIIGEQGAYGRIELKYGGADGDIPDETSWRAHANGNVELYYDNSKKLETTSSGVSVTGDLTASGSVTSNSDISLKTNITTITNALEKVCKLRGVEFDYIESGKHNIGVIAQEVEEVLPELVIGDDPKSVAYGNLTAVLIEAVKELRAEVSSLKQEINTLKGNT